MGDIGFLFSICCLVYSISGPCPPEPLDLGIYYCLHFLGYDIRLYVHSHPRHAYCWLGRLLDFLRLPEPIRPRNNRCRHPLYVAFRCGLTSDIDFTSTDGLLSAAFLMLTLVAPLQTSPTRQRVQIYLWSSVVFVLFSVLLSLFRVKNRGTPSLTAAMSDLIGRRNRLSFLTLPMN